MIFPANPDRPVDIMPEAATALQKKIVPARAAIPGSSAVSAMLKKVMPRVADRALSLDLLLGEVRFGKAPKAEVLEGLSDNDLIFLMEDEHQRRGLCVLTPGVLAALIEMQVAGRVSSAEPPERRATRTDGIVVAGILDLWIEATVAAAREDEIDEALPIVGYRRSDHVLNKRNTDLSLEPSNFKTLSIEMSLGNGAKTGQLIFAIPDVVAFAAVETSQGRMHKHLATIEAPMVAILTRMAVPMETIRNLAVDDVLEVPISALVNVHLEGMGGQKITRARLGQLNGKKAVRLTQGVVDQGERPDLDGPGALPEVGHDAALPPLAAPEPAIGMPEELRELPDLPELPDTEDLPDLPPAGDLPDLPDLPNLPDLPDLPELPELES